MTVDSVDQFMQTRGIIKPSQPFSEAKHQEIYYLTNESNFLNENIASLLKILSFGK